MEVKNVTRLSRTQRQRRAGKRQITPIIYNVPFRAKKSPQMTNKSRFSSLLVNVNTIIKNGLIMCFFWSHFVEISTPEHMQRTNHVQPTPYIYIYDIYVYRTAKNTLFCNVEIAILSLQKYFVKKCKKVTL